MLDFSVNIFNLSNKEKEQQAGHRIQLTNVCHGFLPIINLK